MKKAHLFLCFEDIIPLLSLSLQFSSPPLCRSTAAKIKSRFHRQSRPCLCKVITTRPPVTTVLMMHENNRCPTSIREKKRERGRQTGVWKQGMKD